MRGDVKRFLARGAICVPILLGTVGCERLKPLAAAPPSAQVLFAPATSAAAEIALAADEAPAATALPEDTVTATDATPAETASPDLTLTPTAEVAPMPLQPGESVYLVMVNDTWESIATAINCSADLLLARNLLSGDIAPLPGQQIIIPAECLPAAAPEGESTEYPTAVPDEAETVYPTALPAEPSATAIPTTIEYVVSQGDTLSSIARRYATSVADISALNPALSNVNELAPGTVLVIRPNTAVPVRLHQVRRGESASSIARQYGISVSALIQANGLSDPNHIYVGQVLVIP